jgi:hypothetical protein
MIEAECRFRRITGYRDLAKLVVAIERNLTETTSPAGQGTILVTA